jgi:hypothetical protein
MICISKSTFNHAFEDYSRWSIHYSYVKWQEMNQFNRSHPTKIIMSP